MLKCACACVACAHVFVQCMRRHFLGTVTCLVRQGFQHFMQLSVVPISPGICLSLPPHLWDYKHRTFVFSIQFYVYGYFACLYVCVACGYSVGRGQKRVWDPLEIYIVIYITTGCWDSDPSSLDEQPVFLATEPAFQAYANALLHENWGWNQVLVVSSFQP